MKMNKVFGACALLLALAVVGCNSNPSSEAPASSPAPASQPASVAPSSAAPSSAAPSSATPSSAAPSSEAPSSEAPTNPLLVPLARTWTDGTPANNSDNKEYIPLTDATANKVGVKISIQNYTVESDAESGTTLNSKGQIDPSNKTGAILTYKITAPKAGAYQFVMRGKSKSDALERKLSSRGLTVKVNGEAAEIEGDRQPLTEEDTDFVVVPTLNLTGNEDTIKITACYYRIQFDVASFLLFQEI